MEQEKKVVKKKTKVKRQRKNNTTKKYNPIKKKSITSNKKTNKEQIVIQEKVTQIKNANNIEESNTKEEIKKNSVFNKIKVIAIILCIGLVYYLIDSPVVKKNSENSVHEETNVVEVNLGDSGCLDWGKWCGDSSHQEYAGYCWFFSDRFYGSAECKKYGESINLYCDSLPNTNMCYCVAPDRTPQDYCKKCSEDTYMENFQCKSCPSGQKVNSSQTGCFTSHTITFMSDSGVALFTYQTDENGKIDLSTEIKHSDHGHCGEYTDSQVYIDTTSCTPPDFRSYSVSQLLDGTYSQDDGFYCRGGSSAGAGGCCWYGGNNYQKVMNCTGGKLVPDSCCVTVTSPPTPTPTPTPTTSTLSGCCYENGGYSYSENCRGRIVEDFNCEPTITTTPTPTAPTRSGCCYYNNHIGDL